MPPYSVLAETISSPWSQQREQRGHLRRLARGGRQRRAPALERRHALLEHRHGRIGDARVDVAERLQIEQARRVVGRIEHVRRGLVDRHRARAGGRVGNLAGVQAQRADAEFAVGHGLTLAKAGGKSGLYRADRGSSAARI